MIGRQSKIRVLVCRPLRPVSGAQQNCNRQAGCDGNGKHEEENECKTDRQEIVPATDVLPIYR